MNDFACKLSYLTQSQVYYVQIECPALPKLWAVNYIC